MYQTTWKKIKLAFWDLIIYILSESKWIRTFVRETYWLFFRTDERRLFTLGILVSVIGFFSGILAYLLRVYFG